MSSFIHHFQTSLRPPPEPDIAVDRILEFMKTARVYETLITIQKRLDLVKRFIKQAPDEESSDVDEFVRKFLKNDSRIFQNRFDTLKEFQPVESGDSSSLSINGSHQPSSSGRMEGEEDAGIGGILSRLQKVRFRSFRVGAKGKESKLHGSGNGGDKEMTMGIAEVHGGECNRVVQSSGNDFDDSVGMHAHSEAFYNCEAFEAAEFGKDFIINDVTVAEGTAETAILGTEVTSCDEVKDINHIKSLLQNLELELDSVSCLHYQADVVVPDKTSEGALDTSSEEAHSLSDSSAAVAEFSRKFLNDDNINFQNRFDTLEKSEVVYSGSLPINGSHQPSSSARIEGEEDAGIGGILSRLQKERSEFFRVGAKGKESKFHGSGNGGKKELTMGITEVHGGEFSRVVQSSGDYFDDSVEMHSQSEAFSHCEDSMNPVKPDMWTKWSSRRAGFSEENFEDFSAAAFGEDFIRNDETVAEGTTGTGTDKLGRKVSAGDKMKDSKDIKSLLQYLELELDSVCCLLSYERNVIVPDKLTYLDMVYTFCKLMLPVVLYRVNDRMSFVLPWLISTKDEIERRIRWPYRLIIPDFTAFFIKRTASMEARVFILEWGYFFDIQCEAWAGCTILATDPSGWILVIDADRRRIFYVCIGTLTIHSLTDFPDVLRENQSQLLGIRLQGALRDPPESGTHLIIVLGSFHILASDEKFFVVATLLRNQDNNWNIYWFHDDPALWHISAPVITQTSLLFLSSRYILQVFSLVGMVHTIHPLEELSVNFSVSMALGSSRNLYVYQHRGGTEAPKILKIDMADFTFRTSRKLPCDMYMIEDCRGYTKGR